MLLVLLHDQQAVILIPDELIPRVKEVGGIGAKQKFIARFGVGHGRAAAVKVHGAHRAEAPEQKLAVVIPEDFPISADRRTALEQVLALDPRPAYQEDPDRIYGLSFLEYEVHFQVQGRVLTVLDISPTQHPED